MIFQGYEYSNIMILEDQCPIVFIITCIFIVSSLKRQLFCNYKFKKFRQFSLVYLKKKKLTTETPSL